MWSKMGKNSKKSIKDKASEKTARKTNQKLAAAQKKLIAKLGETDITESISKLEEQQSTLEKVTESVCGPPSPRSSFSIVVHPYQDEIIIFGGEYFDGKRIYIYNEIFFYKISKNGWRRLETPSGPTARSGHQMVSVPIDGGQLWLFGGEYASPSQSQFYHYKDMWMMSMKTKVWTKITSENGPSARSGHRMVYTKKHIFVFGGFYDNYSNSQYFNDLHMFSIDDYQWVSIKLNGNIFPSPRSGCCIASTLDGKVLIWGGYSKSIKRGSEYGITHTDMFCLIPHDEEVNAYEWKVIKPKGYKPLPRSSVGFTSSNNGNVYCFGGVMDTEEDDENVIGQFGDDLYMLDTRNFNYHTIQLKNISESVDTERASKCEEVVSNVFPTNVESISSCSNLHKISILGNSNSFKPSPRMKAGLCIFNHTLYLYGGIFEENDKQFTFNDFYALNLKKMDQWKVLVPCEINVQKWISSDSDESYSESSDSEMDTD